MTEIIRQRRDGKVAVMTQSSAGLPARHLLKRAIGATGWHHVPTEFTAGGLPEGDMIVVVRQDSDAGRSVAKQAGLPGQRLPAGGYRISCSTHASGKKLGVVGGDLFGMLAGLSDALRNSELTRSGLVYRGGERTEKPAFPLRCYWTWDHSTNWMLDDPGNQVNGCENEYLKRPETYLEDYYRLIDHCVEMRFNAVIIWGFLRDRHGGEDFACKVARYAADRGVAILPGVGTTSYGGVYYEGDHPCNLECHLAGNPQRGMTRSDGSPDPHGLSPYRRDNQAWMQHSLEWLFATFPIGGVNLENGDLLVDYARAAKRARANIKSREADYFKDQYVAYKSALDTCHRLAPNAWNTYATYSGFGRGPDVTNAGADMGTDPYFSSRMPPSAIAQWTLTGMLREEPVPLRAWMDSARPADVYKNPKWPRGLRPPTPRSAGFWHQASQCHARLGRGAVAMSTFAEACLRAHDAGMEGVAVVGESTSRLLSSSLNYLVMRHWAYHPVSTLEEFVVRELAPRLGGEREARAFAETLCLLEEGKTAEAAKKMRPYARRAYPYNVAVPWRRTPRAPAGSFMWSQLGEWVTVKKHPRGIAPGSTGIL
ncbi:hypothetical protein HQ590_12545 [bacterium]|nr:hypothetical protein [bacterium]